MSLFLARFPNYIDKKLKQKFTNKKMEEIDGINLTYCPHIGLGGVHILTYDDGAKVDSLSTTDSQSSTSIVSETSKSAPIPFHSPTSNGPSSPSLYKKDDEDGDSGGQYESGDGEFVGERIVTELHQLGDEGRVTQNHNLVMIIDTETAISTSSLTDTDSALTTPTTTKTKKGSGIVKAKRRTRVSCSECSIKSNLWRCLGMDCGIVFCGANGSNHAQEHFQANSDHMIQENMSSRRLWCNLCEREVYKDFRNRRSLPAIWYPRGDPEDFPPRGLYNIGNTCYMNAALQNIAAVAPLTSYFMGDTFHDDETLSRRVSRSYRLLLDELFGHMNCSYLRAIMPSRLLYAVRTAHPIFRGYHQHDSQEFLRLFMDTLASETKVPHFSFDLDSPVNGNPKENQDSDSDAESYETADSGKGSEETLSKEISGAGSPVKIIMKSVLDDVFNGQIESSVQCLFCHETSRRMEAFQDLSLPIPTRDELVTLHERVQYYEQEEGDESVGWFQWAYDWFKWFVWGPLPTLHECLGAFFSSDELKGKNMYSCENCKKLRNGLKQCSLYRLPEVLCVHLKRFRMTDPSGNSQPAKITQRVKFPVDDLDMQPFLHPDCPDRISSYRLMGVICHHGHVGMGHYVSYIRKGETWFLVDDCRVSETTVADVLLCEAYVLFYQKWDTEMEEDEMKHGLLKSWEEADNNSSENDIKFHLISRKWLTQYLWGEEGIPLDNTDVVCPHGRLIPVDNLEMSATWVPDVVWDAIIERYGGGPDLKYHEICQTCAIAWKKLQRTNTQRERERTTSCTSRTMSFTLAADGPFYRNGPVSGSTESLNTTGALLTEWQ